MNNPIVANRDFVVHIIHLATIELIGLLWIIPRLLDFYQHTMYEPNASQKYMGLPYLDKGFHWYHANASGPQGHR